MTRKHSDTNAAAPPAVPHSWPANQWTDKAPAVYPGDTDKGKYLIRTHKTELVEAGALARIGRELIVFGGPYVKWLARKSARVHGYDIAPNRSSEQTAA